MAMEEEVVDGLVAMLLLVGIHFLAKAALPSFSYQIWRPLSAFTRMAMDLLSFSLRDAPAPLNVFLILNNAYSAASVQMGHNWPRMALTALEVWSGSYGVCILFAVLLTN